MDGHGPPPPPTNQPHLNPAFLNCPPQQQQLPPQIMRSPQFQNTNAENSPVTFITFYIHFIIKIIWYYCKL